MSRIKPNQPVYADSILENRKVAVAAIKDRVADLNEFIRHAADFQGIATEFIIVKIEGGNTDTQTLRVLLSERL